MTRLIVGFHAVEQALRAGAGQRLLIRPGDLNSRQSKLLELARTLGCAVERREVASGDTADQGVALEVVPEKPRTEKELEARLAKSPGNLYLVLDGVTDPRNLGACLRSAAGFSVDGVIVPRDHSAPMNEAAVKTASGGASLVPLYQVVNLARTLEKLQKAGFWVVGTVLEDSTPLVEIDLTGPIVLVLGAEDTGLRQKTRKYCDYLARIPMPLQDLSLNVSVATGICLYETTRQRS